MYLYVDRAINGAFIILSVDRINFFFKPMRAPFKCIKPVNTFWVLFFRLDKIIQDRDPSGREIRRGKEL